MNVRLYDGSVRCGEHMDASSYESMTNDPCSYCPQEDPAVVANTMCMHKGCDKRARKLDGPWYGSYCAEHDSPATVVKGSRVSMAVGGTGTVTDIDRGFGEALVRHDTGSVEDMTYGQWHSLASLTPFGYDGTAMVWRGQGMAPAGPQH